MIQISRVLRLAATRRVDNIRDKMAALCTLVYRFPATTFVIGGDLFVLCVQEQTENRRQIRKIRMIHFNTATVNTAVHISRFFG